ncbi:MAG: hypothetical protein ACTSXL_02545 [Alphaproteobacteria bacterium]
MPLKKSEKQARWRNLNEMMLEWYEDETGIPRQEVRNIIRKTMETSKKTSLRSILRP